MKQNQAATANKGGFRERVRALTRQRRFRYGALATTLTAAVIALVVVVNVLFTAMTSNYRWYVDMTSSTGGEGLFTLSEPTVTAIEAVKETTRYEIIFCAEEDMAKSSQKGFYVWNCADAFAHSVDNVTLRYLDVSNPNDLAYFRADKDPSSTTVIVAAYDKDAPVGSQPNSFRRISYDSFFTSDPESGDVYAFDGEYKLALTLLGLSTTKPLVYFVTGHGEQNDEETPLYQLFLDAGYVVKVVDLTRDNLDSDSAVLVINNPQKDIGAYNRTDEEGNPYTVDEVSKIITFLRSHRGNLVVFADFYKYKLPNLQELMSQYGVGVYTDGYVEQDSSLTEDKRTLVAKYPMNQNNTSYGVLPTDKNISTIVKNACGLYISPAHAGQMQDGDGQYTDDYSFLGGPAGGTASTVVSPVLWSDSNATIAGANRAQHILMAMAVTNHYPSEADDASEWTNAETHSFALFCGSGEFMSEAFYDGKESNRYGNRDILYTLFLSISSNSGSIKSLPSNTALKLLPDESLDITVSQADVWTVVCTALLPLAVSICGIVVYVRRKHL